MTPSSAPLYPDTVHNGPDARQKICNRCHAPLPISKFYVNRRNPDGYEHRCKGCCEDYSQELAKRHAIANNEPVEKECRVCKITKPINSFYKASWSADLRDSRCKDCHSFQAAERWKQSPRPPELNRKKNKDWREANRPYLSEQSKGKIFSYYGVTKEWYEATFIKQKGLCAICGIPDKFSGKKRMSIDHNHDCCPTGPGCDKCRRGLLCTKCNTRLGILELGEWVTLATAYLDKYSARNEQR